MLRPRWSSFVASAELHCDFADDVGLNHAMVGQGWALAYYPERGTLPGSRYDADQLEAEQAQRGLWCGSFVPPWVWRLAEPAGSRTVHDHDLCDRADPLASAAAEHGRSGVACGLPVRAVLQCGAAPPSLEPRELLMAEVATLRAAHGPGAGGSAPVLEVSGLRTHFFTDEGVIRAVAGVSFGIGRGETLAVVGESGSGKSVTGLSIMGLLARTPARVVGGRIDFRGRDGRVRNLLELPEAELRRIRGREISMIFQDPTSSLNPVLSIGDQIAETIMLHQGKGRSAAMDLAAGMLAEVGIADPKRRVRDYPHQLSGGMRQRAMIAMALSCDPSLLIADEPTTALDVTIQVQIVELLRRLQLERAMAMLFITHDLALVAEVADRIAVMYAGQVVEAGPADEVLSRPRHPYTLSLLECIPRRDYAGGGRSLRPIPGAVPDPLQPPQGCRFHPRCRLAVGACRAGEIALEEVSPGHGARCLRWRELA